MRKEMWSPDEDEKLKKCVMENASQSWNHVPIITGLRRCGKSCRLRWMNYLRPGLRKCNFSFDEIKIVMELQKKYGNRWSKIASFLEGRTDNDVKNIWNSQMRKIIHKKLNNSSNQLLLPLKSIAHSSSGGSPNNCQTEEKNGALKVNNYHHVSNIPPRIFPFNLDTSAKVERFCEIDGEDQSCLLEQYYVDKLLLSKSNISAIQNNIEVITNNNIGHQKMDIGSNNNTLGLEIDQESTKFDLEKRFYSGDSLNINNTNQDDQNWINMSSPQTCYTNQDHNSVPINPNDIMMKNMVNDNDEGIASIMTTYHQISHNHVQVPSPSMLNPDYFVSPIIDPINIGDFSRFHKLDIENLQWLQGFCGLNK